MLEKLDNYRSTYEEQVGGGLIAEGIMLYSSSSDFILFPLLCGVDVR